MNRFDRLVVIAPTRSTCLNISMVLSNGNIPQTLLMREKGEEIFKAVDGLADGGFGVVAGTGTGKTVAIRDIAGKVLAEGLRVDVVTREHEATDYTWTCNVLVVTPGVALHWLKSRTITEQDLVVIDEIHQTSEHLELSMALAKRNSNMFLWMSATIDPGLYSRYLNASSVIECSAFDPAKKSEVECLRDDCGQLLSSKIDDFVKEERAVAVFVPTRAMAENLSRQFSEHEGLYCDFYHGGEKAEKLRQFLKGDVPKPFMVFMTIAGASSLNILGLDTVVIVDEMYKEVIHSGVPVLEKVRLGNNELLQMGGRVNGRMENSKIYILTSRSIDFHELKPTVPEFVLGGDLQRVALTCGRLGVNLSELELIAPVDHGRYEAEVKRFKNRGILEAESDNLTAYGKQVERLPVEPNWAEILIHAQESGNNDLLNTAVISSCVQSLYSLLRREAKLSEFGVSESDHLTSYNIIVSALGQFGYITKENGNGDVGYRFRGDYVKKYFDKKSKKTVVSKGEFIEWCDQYGFNGKAIKEATLAMKSIYRQLNRRLPRPDELLLVANNDQLHQDFVDLLARVQSLDFVQNEHNSHAGTVWAAQCSMTGANKVLGTIRHWADKRGYQRATCEGTEIPEELVKKYSRKTLKILTGTANNGDEIIVEYEASFAGEKIGSISENLIEVPAEFVDKAVEVFANAIVRDKVDIPEIIVNNKMIKENIYDLHLRSGGEIPNNAEEKIREFYLGICKEAGVYTRNKFLASREKVDLLDLDSILLPEIREEIKEANPDWIKADGETLSVEYGKDWNSFYARTEVSEEFARETVIEALTLPSGRQIKLLCVSHSAKTFPELVEKLEQERIEREWREKRSKLEHASWISNPEEVFPYLPKLLDAVEITRTDNGEGKPIYGYFYLYSDSALDFQIRLRESREKAEEETKVGLERLLKRACREVLAVPKEEPYYSASGWSGSWTELGEALKKRLEELAKSKADGITAENIFVRVEEIKAEVENIKAEVGGKFSETQKLISETEAKVNIKVEEINSEDREFVEAEIGQAREALQEAKKNLKTLAYAEAEAACADAENAVSGLAALVSARTKAREEAKAAKGEVSDELYNLQYGYKEFVDAAAEERSEAYELSQEISNALSDCRYEAALDKVAEARELIARVRSVMPDRQAARRARFPEAVWDAVGDNEHIAEKAVELAKTAAGLVGAENALRIFVGELEAAYGRAKRQDAIRDSILYEIAQTDIGDLFLGLYRARDVDAWLAGAVAWLEANRETEKPKAKAAGSNGSGEFTLTEHRYFRCACGCQTRLAKSEWKDFQARQTLEVRCSVCGESGIIKDASAK